MDYSPGWHAWPPEVKQIPFNTLHLGIGPGEQRLAALMRGEVQGGSVSFDIMTADGRRWEVKNPRNWLIRVAVAGRIAISSAQSERAYAIRKLIQGLQSVQKYIPLESIFKKDELDKIFFFIEHDVPMIRKGEITAARMNRFHEVLKVIHRKIRDEDPADKKTVALKDKDVSIKKNVSAGTFVKVGAVIDVDLKNLKVSDKELMAGFFAAAPFQDPDKFMDRTWNRMLTGTDVFGHVDGVILVREDGYRVILPKDFDKAFLFYSISQGMPKMMVAREFRK